MTPDRDSRVASPSQMGASSENVKKNKSLTGAF